MTRPRHRAREAALRVLYFWEVGGVQPDQALGAYFREHEPEASEAVKAFATTLVHGTIADIPALDTLIEQHADNWRVSRLAVIDRLILRMAAWELTQTTDTPAAVILNEALELARTFSSDDSVRFVNGVLDGIRRSLPGVGPTGPAGAADE